MSQYKIFYSFILGAVGAASGWIVMAGLLTFDASDLSWTTLVVKGALLGGCIGVCATAFESLFAGSVAQTAKIALTGLALGLVAGGLALPFGQWIYSGGAEASRVSQILVALVAWAFFGSVIGLGEGLTKGSQVWKAMLGGLVGGLAGGILFELFGRAWTQDEIDGQQIFVAITLSVLGGFIGASVALVTTVLQDAWLAVKSGKLAGSEINISKFVVRRQAKAAVGIIGSSGWEAQIYLPGDVTVQPRHARITVDDGVPILQLLPEAEKQGATMEVNGREVTRHSLSRGDRIRLGSTEFVYHDKRK